MRWLIPICCAISLVVCASRDLPQSRVYDRTMSYAAHCTQVRERGRFSSRYVIEVHDRAPPVSPDGHVVISMLSIGSSEVGGAIACEAHQEHFWLPRSVCPSRMLVTLTGRWRMAVAMMPIARWGCREARIAALSEWVHASIICNVVQIGGRNRRHTG